MTNLDWALAAYTNSVEPLRRFGSDNKRNLTLPAPTTPEGLYDAEVKRTGKKTAMAKLKLAQPNRGAPLNTIVQYGRTVLAEQAGNCFEHAAAACSYLAAQRPRPTFDVVRMPQLDHAFVVIGQPFPADDGEYPQDFGTWGVDAAICDGWAEIYCLARDYPQRWNNQMDIWHAAGVEVPHPNGNAQWTAPTQYKDCVQNEVKESYSWRQARGCCFITTATCETFGLPDDCRELETLRWYRNHVMMATPEGAADVARYYEIAPRIVSAINARVDAVPIYHDIYHRIILPAVVAVERGDRQTPYRLFATLLDEMATMAGIGRGA